MTTVSVIRAAVAAAVRAPSPYNTQPWRFTIRPDAVDLWLDRTRVLPITDPDAHEARIACGAALFTLRLALAIAGHHTTVAILPDRATPDLLATATLDGKHHPSTHHHTLFDAVWRRHTNRRPFLDWPVPTPARTAMARAATQEGADLHLIDHPAPLGTITDLIRRADHVLGQNPDHVAEVSAWLGPDGIPPLAAGRPSTPDSLLVLRDLGSTAGSVAFERRPLLAALTTIGSTPTYDLVAGQALQRVLLEACAAGLAVSPLSQPIEVPSTLSALNTLVGATTHLVLRIGYGHPGVPTPRRPVTDVTTTLP
ncbi:Acg family FMN-binding oxidoreductase [Actinokineospora inagensis]|uniref:Acg family FMN-binding oxidoreductase n=1 Tax=Actinokineospora inagensis TaxID=103730 RepID=UPI00040C1359|nr:hypothetical protein [Actinokineospora inagensis]